MRTRYAGERDRAWRAYFEHLQTATALRAEARMDAAAAIYATALRAHPDEPNALFLLGKLFEDEDRPHAARLLLRDAIYLNGDAAQYHLALGRVCERLDAHEEARDAYASAARFDPSLRATADEALARIARCLLSTSAGAVAPGVEVGRNVRCPCGSGLRFKACHGALHAGVASTTVAQVSDVHERMTSAVVAAQTGDISNARRLYGEVLARDAANVDALHALALLELDMGDIHGASDRIELALKHAPNDLQIMEDRQRIRMAVHERAEAMRVNGKLAELPYLVPGTASLAPLDRAIDIHVVAAFRDANGSREFAALALARMLAEDAPVTVWSTHAGLAPQFAARGVREIGVGQGNFPQSGAIIFVNVDPLPAVWLDASAASRVVAVHDTNQPAALLDLVVTMHRSTSCPIQLVTPSETFRRRCGVPAASCPLPVDLERFQPSRRCSRRRPFTIGRVSANDHRLFHPQDPALIRQLLDSGSAVRILGGTVLMRNFAPSKPLPGLELLAADAMTAPEFLRDIDCVFYRTSPLHAEAGGDSIAQALATGIPVVCARDVGYSELISHGVDGFVFDRDDDDEALRQLGLLHADVALRERMGRAARAKAEAVFGPSLTRRLRRIYAGADSAADRLRVQPACATA